MRSLARRAVRVTLGVATMGLMMAAACGNAGVRDGAVGDPGAAAPDRLVVPGERIGPVDRDASEAALIEALGAAAVVRAPIYLAEGFCVPGTTLFPTTPDRLEIGWIDSLRTRPAFVTAREPGASWRTVRGVGIGTTLDELEAIAGGPVTFGGFGWDYGGGMSWGEANAEQPAAGLLGLRVGPDPDAWNRYRADRRIGDLLGEREVRSDHPLLDSIPVRVEELHLGWGIPYGERSCEFEPAGR